MEGQCKTFIFLIRCSCLREIFMLPDEWKFAGFPNGVKLKQQAGWPRETRFMSQLQGMDWCGVHAHRAWTDRVCAATPAFKWHSRYAHWIGDRITLINGGIVNSSVNLCKRYSTPQKIYVIIGCVSRLGAVKLVKKMIFSEIFWGWLFTESFEGWGLRFLMRTACCWFGGSSMVTTKGFSQNF